MLFSNVDHGADIVVIGVYRPEGHLSTVWNVRATLFNGAGPEESCIPFLQVTPWVAGAEGIDLITGRCPSLGRGRRL